MKSSRRARIAGDVQTPSPAPRLVLPAKLSRPSPDGAIARPRLFKALDKLKRRPITWVHAPAGAGKTTLLASYASETALWYEVDAGDADPSGLFHELGVAAEQLLGRRLSLPTPRPGSPEAQRAFAGHYFRTLFAVLDKPAMLVFDNYHAAAHAPAWNDMFRELCGAIEAQIRVIVLSRVAPPASLARFCGNGDLEILDWSALRLDQREIESFVEGCEERAFDSAELLSLTDGWAVAISLLAKSKASPAALGQPAAGPRSGPAAELNNESIFRFLAGEIFDRLDTESRELLLELSLLPSFTAQMAESLTGRSGAVTILARLHDDHLLVERYGELGFRVHDLFRNFLLHRARSSRGEDAWRALSIRAAAVLEGDGQFSAAVEALASVRAFEALADLIERSGPQLAARARFSTLAAAIDRLPFAHREPRPWLGYWEATTLLGQPGTRAQQLAEKAFADFRARGDAAGALLAWSLIVHAIVIGGDDFGSLGRWLKTLEELSLEPPSPAIAVRVAIGEVLAYSFWATGTQRALEAADRALELVARYGGAEDRVQAWGAALLVFHVGGRPDRAADLRRSSRAMIDEAGDRALIKLAYLHSDALLEMWNASFAGSLRAVHEGLALAASSGVEVWNGSLTIIGILSAIGCGDHAQAEQLLDAMGAAVAAGAPRFARAQYAYGRAWLAFERGDVECALRWLRDCMHEGSTLGFDFGDVQEQLAMVIFAGAKGDARAVAEAVAKLEAGCRNIPQAWIAAAADLAKAYAYSWTDEEVGEQVRRALHVLRDAGYINLGYFGPRVIARVISVALENEIEPELTQAVLRNYKIAPGPDAVTTSAWPWPIKIKTFGALEIELDGRPLAFGRKTPGVPLKLLGVLAAAGGPVTAARMMSALWPASGAASRGSLDTAIYRLRKLLGREDAVETAGGTIALAPSICWTDVRAFSVWCDRIAASNEPPRAALERFERNLLELYRGPFGEDGDPPALVRARDQLRRRFGQAIGALARAWIAAGAADRADRLLSSARARDERVAI